MLGYIVHVIIYRVSYKWSYYCTAYAIFRRIGRYNTECFVLLAGAKNGNPLPKEDLKIRRFKL